MSVDLRIALSPVPQFTVNPRDDEDQALWQQDNDPAVEIAVTAATLRHMMLYNGALVRVGSLLNSTTDFLRAFWHVPQFLFI